MILRPPRSTRTDTLLPYTTLFRSDSVAIVNQIQKNYFGYFKSLPANTAERFINWVVNESVYKDVFLEYDVDKIIKENAWAVRTDLPGRVVVSAKIGRAHV